MNSVIESVSESMLNTQQLKKLSILRIVNKRISFHCQTITLLPPKPKTYLRQLKLGIQEFHRKYEMTPADKAANNAGNVWRLHYVNLIIL